MAPKRSLEDVKNGDEPKAKKPRSRFQVGPDNLPDGTYRRKVIKIKKDLIHKAKIRKSYEKLKAREKIQPSRFPIASVEPVPQESHPDHQAMLDTPQEGSLPDQDPHTRRPRGKKPGYFEKEQAFAAQKKAEAEARRLEFERREQERREKIEERERFRKTMAKARTGGKNGQRKLGRESTVLLEKVKRIVGH